MPCMLNLEQMLELTKHRFHQHPWSEDAYFVQHEQAIGHIPFEMGHEENPSCLQELTSQGCCLIPLSPTNRPYSRSAGLSTGRWSSTLPSVSGQASNTPWWLITICNLKP